MTKCKQKLKRIVEWNDNHSLFSLSIHVQDKNKIDSPFITDDSKNYVLFNEGVNDKFTVLQSKCQRVLWKRVFVITVDVIEHCRIGNFHALKSRNHNLWLIDCTFVFLPGMSLRANSDQRVKRTYTLLHWIQLMATL